MSLTHETCEVAIVGAGLAGTTTASVLARAGHRVALIDTNAVFPYEFRAEKLGSAQMEAFDRLGLGVAARAVATPTDEVRVVRFGSLDARERKREYGFCYAALINSLRAHLPAGLELTLGRVAEIEPSPERTRLTLSNGRVIDARVLVIATGLGELVRRKVGIEPDTISERHSLSLGFDMAAPVGAFPFEALTYYAERFGTRAAYLTLFPIGTTMRANLFVYRQPNEPWTKAFRLGPSTELAALFPRLSRFCPDLAVEGRVEIRPIDLLRAKDPACDGVVLVGDAFQTPCPIPGTGIGKVLVDVERLCGTHIPRWLQQPVVTRSDVAAFYADPVKQASDAGSLHASLYAREIATQASPVWTARRARNLVGRHVLHVLHQARAGVSGARNGPQRIQPVS